MKPRPPHVRRAEWPDGTWPTPPLHVVLVEPEIPGNTGNIARMCAATGTRLHLVEPLGFRITDADLKRAGLDYWHAIDVRRHADFDSFVRAEAPARLFLFSTRSGRSYWDAGFRAGDALVFGSESRGLPDALLDAHPESVVGIPIRSDLVRSLNLSTAAGIAVYEAIRQIAGPDR